MSRLRSTSQRIQVFVSVDRHRSIVGGFVETPNFGGRKPKVNRKVRMQKITPFLWVDDQAEDAAKFYTSIFNDSKIGRIFRCTEEAAETTGLAVGSVLTIEFEIEGQKFVALNGGPQFKFNESLSFVVNCETQEEVDYFWKKLTAIGGVVSAFGLLKGQFGLFCQITAIVLIDMLEAADPAKSSGVMHPILQMQE